MQKRILGLSRKEHLVYILAIIIAGGYFQRKTSTQARLQSAIEDIVPIATNYLAEINQVLWFDFRYDWDIFPHEPIVDYWTRAEAIKQQTSAFSDTLNRIGQYQNQKELLSALQVQLGRMSALSDTILRICNTDSACAMRLKKALPDAEAFDVKQLAGTLNSAKQADIVRLIQTLQLRVQLMGAIGILYCYEQPLAHRIRYRPVPEIFGTKTCVKVGETFDADFFLRSCVEENFTITINGRQYPRQGGMAKYKRRYSTPGRHLLEVRIIYQSPFDSTRPYVFTKLFEVHVGPQ